MNKASWILAGAAAALAAAAPASAQRGHAGGAPSFSSGHHNGPGRGGFHGARGGFGNGLRCGRSTRNCFGGPFLDLGWGYGGLIDDPEYAGRDDGFFAGAAEVQAANGGAYYDYDRAYPYDWYHDPRDAARAGSRFASATPAVHCDVAWVSGRRGERSAVRVCRGSR
jgi:hypothetical protein